MTWKIMLTFTIETVFEHECVCGTKTAGNTVVIIYKIHNMKRLVLICTKCSSKLKTVCTWCSSKRHQVYQLNI